MAGKIAVAGYIKSMNVYVNPKYNANNNEKLRIVLTDDSGAEYSLFLSIRPSTWKEETIAGHTAWTVQDWTEYGQLKVAAQKKEVFLIEDFYPAETEGESKITITNVVSEPDITGCFVAFGVKKKLNKKKGMEFTNYVVDYFGKERPEKYSNSKLPITSKITNDTITTDETKPKKKADIIREENAKSKNPMSEEEIEALIQENIDEDDSDDPDDPEDADKTPVITEVILSTSNPDVAFAVKYLKNKEKWEIQIIHKEQRIFPCVYSKDDLLTYNKDRERTTASILVSNMKCTRKEAVELVREVSNTAGKRSDELAELTKSTKVKKSEKTEPTEPTAPERLDGCFLPDDFFVDLKSGEYDKNSCGRLFYYIQVGKAVLRETLCNCLAMVTGHFESIDTALSKVEISFTVSDSTDEVRWKRLIVPLSTIGTIEGIKLLVSEGLSVTPKHFSKMAEYLMACKSYNQNNPNSKFTNGFTNDYTGWKGEGFTQFCDGNTMLCDENGVLVEKSAFFTNRDVANKLTPKGTLEEWIKAVAPLAVFARVRFVMYDSMASILLKPLYITPHTGLLIGRTSTGKTTTECVAASLIGNPDDTGKGLLYCGDISIAALNIHLHQYMDLPTFLDESTATTDKVRKVLLYVVGNGQSAARARRDGETLRPRSEHMTNLYISAERSMIPDGVDDGAPVRALKINDRTIPMGNQTIVDAAKDGLKRNYGHILKLFIAKVYKHRTELPKWLNEAKERLTESAPSDIIKRQATYYAAAEVAGMLLEEVFVDIGFPSTAKPAEIIDMMWQECAINDAEELMPIKALEALLNFITVKFNMHGICNDVINETYFDNQGFERERPLRKVDIMIYDVPLYYDIVPSSCTKALHEAGFENHEAVYRFFKDNGVTATVEKRFTSKHWHYISIDAEKKTQFHVIRIKKAKMFELLGLEHENHNDELYLKLTAFVKRYAILPSPIVMTGDFCKAYSGYYEYTVLAIAEQIIEEMRELKKGTEHIATGFIHKENVWDYSGDDTL